MKKLYDKSKLCFALLWIALYCILMSLGDSLSSEIGMEKSVTVVIGLLLSAFLLVFLKRNGLIKEYGLCRPTGELRLVAYYIPLLLMLSANLWFGAEFRLGAAETLFYILAMLCVGFLEEVIFRGLLFGAMRESSPRAAVIVSSVSFGIGHIINLVNGSGAELLPNLLQVVYATAAGFMFVMIYLRTKSLILCIVAHGIFNALSVFSVEPPTAIARIVSCVLLTLITGGYALYLSYTVKKVP